MTDRRAEDRGTTPTNAYRQALEVFQATTPGFEIACLRCGSKSVGFDSDGYSNISGGWGGMFLKCAICRQQEYLWEA